jgi:hypothetical protein
MSLRFAAAHDPVRRITQHAAGRGLVARAERQAANDNRPDAAAAAFDPVLKSALHHFAAHGLAAAHAAAGEAEAAEMRGDAPAKARWLAITAMFDRRLAAVVANAAENGAEVAAAPV